MTTNQKPLTVGELSKLFNEKFSDGEVIVNSPELCTLQGYLYNIRYIRSDSHVPEPSDYIADIIRRHLEIDQSQAFIKKYRDSLQTK